jgi:hypothetical protein
MKFLAILPALLLAVPAAAATIQFDADGNITGVTDLRAAGTSWDLRVFPDGDAYETFEANNQVYYRDFPDVHNMVGREFAKTLNTLEWPDDRDQRYQRYSRGLAVEIAIPFRSDERPAGVTIPLWVFMTRLGDVGGELGVTDDYSCCTLLVSNGGHRSWGETTVYADPAVPAQVVPLPASAALLAPAVAGLGWLGYRRRRR